MKFALVSHGLPPSPSVQSVVLHRLLRALNPADYCLITQESKKSIANGASVDRLPAKYYYLSRWVNFPRGTGLGVIRWWNVWVRAIRIARILRLERCEAVIGCTSELFDLPASYLASRLTGVKFYAYLLDYYAPTAAGSKGEKFARRLEPLMMKAAAGIIVPNEFLRDELFERYGVKSTIIRNPCDLSQYGNAPPFGRALNSGTEIKIVYTGSIYEAHYSAFQNLIAAIRLIRKWTIKLHVYSNQPASRLAEARLTGPVVFEKPVPAAQVPKTQWEADVLFFPLSFTSPYPEIIRTSSPGKMGEYLASARPVLVHVPADAYLAWYFRTYDCGMVVSQSDPTQLAQAIEAILTDDNLRLRLVANAKERARADFSIAAAQRAFAKLMEVRSAT